MTTEGPESSGQQENRIAFHFEDVHTDLPDTELLRQWITAVIKRENHQLRSVQIVFCSDEYLLHLNQTYLQHDTLTDIITFPYQNPPVIEGDLFISLERVTENAGIYGVTEQQELCRVIIHGVLHLCGYADKTSEERDRMRERENTSLRLLASYQAGIF